MSDYCPIDWFVTPKFIYREEIFTWVDVNYQKSDWLFNAISMDAYGMTMEIKFKDSAHLTLFLLRWLSEIELIK